MIDLLWLVPALPLLGFVLNDALALSREALYTAEGSDWFWQFGAD